MLTRTQPGDSLQQIAHDLGEHWGVANADRFTETLLRLASMAIREDLQAAFIQGARETYRHQRYIRDSYSAGKSPYKENRTNG